MKALWLENNQISLRDVPQPNKPNEALIKIRKAGICSTDLELVKGYYPYTGVLGHEFVGEVVSAPDALDRSARGGRDQRCLRKMRSLPERTPHALREPHRAGHRQP